MTDIITNNNSLALSENISLSLCTSLSSCSNGSTWNITEEYIPHGTRPETYIVPILFAIIFIIGCLGNGSLIFFFFRYPQMRKPPNTYIFSLALGDLLVILFCVPFVATIYITESWPFGLVVCKISEGMRDLSIGVSVFTLTALSAERYVAIVVPVSRRAINHSAKKNIAIIWIFSLILSFPGLIFSSVLYFPIADGTSIAACFPFPPYLGKTYSKVVILTKLLIFYVIPLSVIGSLYCLMARHLVRTSEALPGEGPRHCHRINQMTARRKVAKMVLAFVFLFAICFLPNHIFLVWFQFNPKAEEHYNYVWNVFRIVGFCLVFVNSCINPVALYCVSGTFRKHFNHHLFCCAWCDKNFHDRSLTNLRGQSSAGLTNTRTDQIQIEMSTFNGIEKNFIVRDLRHH